MTFLFEIWGLTHFNTTIFLLGSGIKCHICNSYDSYHCGDPFYYPDSPDKPKTDKFLQECGTDQQYTFCRKIYQKGKLTQSLLGIDEQYLLQFNRS